MKEIRLVYLIDHNVCTKVRHVERKIAVTHFVNNPDNRLFFSL